MSDLSLVLDPLTFGFPQYSSGSNNLTDKFISPYSLGKNIVIKSARHTEELKCRGLKAQCTKPNSRFTKLNAINKKYSNK